MTLNQLQEKFRSLFESDPLLYASPGRINLIGEHTDYNNGFVLPGAVDKRIYFAVKPNGLNRYRLHSLDFKDSIEIPVGMPNKTDKQWANYLLGVIAQIRKKGLKVPGFDLAFFGDIPQGAGMSSSAALETGLVYALNDLFEFYLTPGSMAMLAQAAEHEFIGVQCGIMDQFAAIYGKQDRLIRLDCETLEFEYEPLNLKDHALLLVNSGVKHNLAASEYNKRRAECDAAVAYFRQYGPGIESLRDVSRELLETSESKLDATLYKRSRFVIGENQRVLYTADALKKSDLLTVGGLLYESHYGLRDDYEVTCAETDFLVGLAEQTEGVIGARQMGGGFGGCTLNLIDKNALDKFKITIPEKYKTPNGAAPELYEVSLSEGSRQIQI